jgi:hypothetical protein
VSTPSIGIAEGLDQVPVIPVSYWAPVEFAERSAVLPVGCGGLASVVGGTGVLLERRQQ